MPLLTCDEQQGVVAEASHSKQAALTELIAQVGSKQAAFFMGQSVKVTTKPADSPYVHELALVAEELEQRYKDSKVMLVKQHSVTSRSCSRPFLQLVHATRTQCSLYQYDIVLLISHLHCKGCSESLAATALQHRLIVS